MAPTAGAKAGQHAAADVEHFAFGSALAAEPWYVGRTGMVDHGSGPILDERPLTAAERELTEWMLQHGRPEALAFLALLEHATVISRCPCGCASVDFAIRGQPAPAAGLNILGDYLFGEQDELAGAFVFECGGVLAGIEVYGLARDNPKELPHPDSLRPFKQG
jgi:hypothetical protein